jgi:hypothetical protein
MEDKQPIDDGWRDAGGLGLDKEYKNIKTGETTAKKYTMNKVSRFDGCDHYWELVDPHGSQIQCQKCELGAIIVWGIHILKDGKVIKVKHS